MALADETKQSLVEYLLGWTGELARKKKRMYMKLESGQAAPAGGHKPFHEVLLPGSVSRSSNFERSFSSGLGTTYEHCAEVVARQKFGTVRRQHDLSGFVPADSLAEIDNILHNVNSRKMRADYRSEVDRLVRLARGDGSARVSRDVRSDLYVRDGAGNEAYIEFKSPVPNKDQCLTTTRKHLTIHCIRKMPFPKTCTYFGMAYNPYGAGEYRHSIARTYLDVKNHVLVGKPLWDMLGGPGTYEDILEVYAKAGRLGGTSAIQDAVGA